MIDTIYSIDTKVASVRYPEKFAEKIKKMFNGDEGLFARALEQVDHRKYDISIDGGDSRSCILF